MEVASLGAVVLVLTSLAATHANAPDCKVILDGDARLQCYDAVFGPPEALTAPTVAEDDVSLVGELRERRVELSRDWMAITPHRTNYILPATYQIDPDFREYEQLGADPDDIEDVEAKFQLSLRTLLWQEMFGSGWSLAGAYTQQSYWQVYSGDISAPFRETNYEPEFLFEYPLDREVLGFRIQSVGVGLNHQSNGRAAELSRSWNRVTAQMVLESGNFVTVVRPWWRIPEPDDEDDNPDIERYMGQIEFGFAYRWHDQTFAALLRNNLRSENKSGLQIDWSFPLAARLKGYIQLYTGYGENLIDGDNYQNRIGIGVMLTDWL